MLQPDDLYLDHNATRPLSADARAAMEEALNKCLVNPASTHRAGQRSAQLLEEARAIVARTIGLDPRAVVFTSGGSESNQLAIFGRFPPGRPAHLLVGSTEHSSVLGPARALAARGTAVDVLPCASDGTISPETVLDKLRPETALVCLMSANNETGVRHPLEEIASELIQRKVPLHIDAIQSLGKEPIRWREWGATSLSLSAHKIGGPAGIGALVLDRNAPFQSWIPGVEQERGRRGGTPNLLGTLGFAAAMARAAQDSADRAVRDLFETSLKQVFPGVQVNGEGAPRLGNTSSVSFPHQDGRVLVAELSRRGVHTSVGSACHAGSATPSHVLRAMGRTASEVRGSIRFSFGPEHSQSTIDALIRRIREAMAALSAPEKIA